MIHQLITETPIDAVVGGQMAFRRHKLNPSPLSVSRPLVC